MRRRRSLIDEKAGKVLAQFQQHFNKSNATTHLPWERDKLGKPDIDKEGQLGIIDSEEQWSLPGKDLSMRARVWIA